jgi:hypothetical protein
MKLLSRTNQAYPRSISKMSSNTIAKMLKESDALLKASEEESPLLVGILKLVHATLKIVVSQEKIAKKSRKSELDDDTKPKRKPSAWAAWVRDIKNAHPDEYSEYKTEHPDKKSHVIDFAKVWKDDHSDEYDAFVASYKSDTDAEDEEKPKAKAKAKKVSSDTETDAEEKPKAKSKAKAKAKKVSSDTETDAEEKPKAKPGPKKTVVKKPVGGAGAATSDSESDLDID